MGGRGTPAPPGQARHRNRVKYDWTHAPGEGWRHGKKPAAPQGLMPKSRKAWRMWFEGWWAAFWEPEDVSQLELCILLYDQVVRGDTASMTKLQPMLDRYGITPKGRMDLRWAPPRGDDAAAEQEQADQADELEERRRSRRKKLA